MWGVSGALLSVVSEAALAPHTNTVLALKQILDWSGNQLIVVEEL